MNNDDRIELPAASLISLPHPLRPDGKDISYAPFLPGETLGAYVARTGVRVARGALNVWHNGRPVPEALWTRLIPRTGDMIVVRARPEGGGGGNKVLRTVAMLALVVTTYGVGSAWGGLAASIGGSYAGAVGAAMMVGGTLIINPLFPEIAP